MTGTGLSSQEALIRRSSAHLPTICACCENLTAHIGYELASTLIGFFHYLGDSICVNPSTHLAVSFLVVGDLSLPFRRATLLPTAGFSPALDESQQTFLNVSPVDDTACCSSTSAALCCRSCGGSRGRIATWRSFSYMCWMVRRSSSGMVWGLEERMSSICKAIIHLSRGEVLSM